MVPPVRGFFVGFYMSEVSLHYISDEYIDYLSRIDNKVKNNKNETRPYLVLRVAINDCEYYVPFSSPKFSEDGKFKKPNIYKKLYKILKRDNQNKTEYLGSLLFANMITAPISEVIYIDLSEMFAVDEQYAVLLTKQIDIIKNDLDEIENTAKTVHKMYTTIKRKETNDPQTLTEPEKYILRCCCNFLDIEEACRQFQTNLPM